MSREYPTRPFLGVGVIIFDVKKDSVLLVERGRPPAEGLFSVPGGGVEIGETLEEAAKREVFEETGLRVEIGPLVDVVEPISKGKDNRVQFHYVVLDFLAITWEGTVRPGEDARKVLWVKQQVLTHFPTTEGLLPVIQKAKMLASTMQTRKKKE